MLSRRAPDIDSRFQVVAVLFAQLGGAEETSPCLCLYLRLYLRAGLQHPVGKADREF